MKTKGANMTLKSSKRNCTNKKPEAHSTKDFVSDAFSW